MHHHPKVDLIFSHNLPGRSLTVCAASLCISLGFTEILAKKVARRPPAPASAGLLPLSVSTTAVSRANHTFRSFATSFVLSFDVVAHRRRKEEGKKSLERDGETHRLTPTGWQTDRPTKGGLD